MKSQTEKKWRGQYAAWQESGQTQREYCKAVGINYRSFKNMPKKNKERSSTVESAKFKLAELTVKSEKLALKKTP